MEISPQELNNLINNLRSKRWFQSKSKEIISTKIIDSLELSKELTIIFLEIEFTDESKEIYFLAVDPSQYNFQDCVQDNQFIFHWLTQLSDENEIQTENKAKISFLENKSSLEEFKITNNSQFHFLNVEQSNSSIIIDKKYIIKILRKLTEGRNPETEILSNLNQFNLNFIPQLLGQIEYRIGNKSFLLASIQEYIENQGDCWEYAVNLIENYFQSSSELKDFDNDETLQSVIQLARGLAQVTAQMHIALSKVENASGFAPENFVDEDLQLIHQEFDSEMRKALPHLAVQNPRNIFTELDELKNSFNTILRELVNKNVQKVRIHGDYHLGQVLKTKSNFIVIDFEGEPLKTLEQRRCKSSPFKDVAGMLRSFDYAILSINKKEQSRINKGLSNELYELLRNEFISAYLLGVKNKNFVFQENALNIQLIKFYEIQKAFYEIVYEANNRPSWLDIPVQVLERLISE